MHYLATLKNSSGAYHAPQSSYVPGLCSLPDVLLDDFLAYNGFVDLTIEDGVVTAIEPNSEAWEAWKASLPEPTPPEPTEQEDLAALAVEHEYRLTLLELGVTSDAV